MLVTANDLEAVQAKLSLPPRLALDTETTGLYPWAYNGGRPFAVILATEEDSFYFNMNDKPDHNGTHPISYFSPEIMTKVLSECLNASQP